MTENPHTDLLAIAHGTTGNRAHLYPGPKAMLSDLPVGTDGGDRSMEYFDADGYRLAPVFDTGWQFVSLQRTDDPADPGLVLARFRAVVDQVRAYLVDNADELQAHGLQVSVGLGLLADLDGLDLPMSFQKGRLLFGHDFEPDHGSALHNWLVHGIFG
jgi:hypothetical protein